jgi:hypothetical protein
MYTYGDAAKDDDDMEEGWDYGEEEQIFEDLNTGAVEDSSWKVRRGAVRVMQAIICTRGELLPEIIKNYGVAIAERFKERVDLVKCDIFDAFKALALNNGTATDEVKKQKFAPIAQ